MSKQTAVDWMRQSIENTSIHWGSELYYNQKGESFNCIVIKIQPEKLDEFFLKAKQMEKEQIEDAFNAGENFSKLYFLQPYNTPECKVYYQQTYGGDHE